MAAVFLLLSDVFCCFFTIVAVITNVLLLLLTMYRSPKLMGNYRILLIYACTLQITSAILNVLIRPVTRSFKTQMITVIRLEYFMTNPRVNTVLGYMHTGMCLATLHLLAIQFLYRYMAMTSKKMYLWFLNRKFYIWPVLPVLTAAIFCATYWIGFRSTLELGTGVKDTLFDDFELQMDQSVYLGVQFYRQDEFGNWNIEIGWAIALGIMALMAILPIVSLVNSAYESTMIIYRQNKNKVFLRFRKTVPRQLFYALLAQTTIPFALLYAPLAVTFIALFIPYDVGRFSTFISFSNALIPAIMPIPVIIIVQPYRAALMDIFSTKTTVTNVQPIT